MLLQLTKRTTQVSDRGNSNDDRDSSSPLLRNRPLTPEMKNNNIKYQFIMILTCLLLKTGKRVKTDFRQLF